MDFLLVGFSINSLAVDSRTTDVFSVDSNYNLRSRLGNLWICDLKILVQRVDQISPRYICRPQNAGIRSSNVSKSWTWSTVKFNYECRVTRLIRDRRFTASDLDANF